MAQNAPLLVTIIVPTYDGERFLGRAIQSVLDQTYRNWELILVDDGSHDGTRKIISKFEKIDSRVRSFFLDSNSGGPAKPRNFGIRHSKGEFVFFLDQDDIYFPDNIEKKVSSFVSDGDIDVIMGSGWGVDPSKGVIFDYVTGLLSNIAIKKKVFEDVGYFDELEKSTSDAGWHLQYLIKKGNSQKIKTLFEPTTLYFRHDAQDSNIQKSGIKNFINKSIALVNETEGLLERIKLTGDVAHDVGKHLAWVSARVGDYLCLLGDTASARQHWKKSLAFCVSAPPIILWGMSFLPTDAYKKLQGVMKFLYNGLGASRRIAWGKRKFPESYRQTLDNLKCGVYSVAVDDEQASGF